MRRFPFSYFWLLILVSCSNPTQNPDNQSEFATSQKSKTEGEISKESSSKKANPESEEIEDPEEPDEQKPWNYELEIVDSIQVDFLGISNLVAVHGNRDLFLFSGGIMGDKMFLANRTGKIVSKFDQPADAPTAYSGNCSGATFIGDTIAIQSYTGINLYDLNFNLIKSNRRTYGASGSILSGYDNISGAKMGRKSGVLVFNGNAQVDNRTNTPEYFKNYNTLDWIDFDSASFDPILPLHPDSHLLKVKASFDFFLTHFQVKGNQLTFAYHVDPALYDVNLNDPKLSQKRTPIPIPDFILNQGHPFGTQLNPTERRDRSGIISGLHKSGSFDLIIFNEGLKIERFPEGIKDPQERIKEIRRRDPDKWLLRLNGGEFTTPKTLSTKYKIARTDSRGRIWAAQNIQELEEEPELVTIYELKIVKK